MNNRVFLVLLSFFLGSLVACSKSETAEKSGSFPKTGEVYQLEGLGWDAGIKVLEVGNDGWVKAVVDHVGEFETISSGDTTWININTAMAAKQVRY